MNKHTGRLLAVDVVRGVAVILMVLTHLWISFYWNNTNPIGTTVSYIGGYLSFSIFLIISGFTFGLAYKSHTFLKIMGRSGVLIAVYLGLGLLYTLLQKKDLYTIFTSPIYLEEYLLTLAIFPIVGYFITQVSRRLSLFKSLLLHNVGAFVVIIIGLALVWIGKYTAGANDNYWLSLIVGSSTFHTFPVISYFVIYGVGMWLGWSFKLESPKNFGAEATAIILSTAVVSIVAVPLESISFSLQSLDAIRWPPTLFFITSSLAVSASLLYGATLLEHLHNGPVGKVLQFIGKKALFILVLHLAIIYLVQGVVLAKVTQVINNQPPTPTPLSRVAIIAQDFTKALDTSTSWPFKGYKVAIIDLPELAQKQPYFIEIKPDDLDILGAAQNLFVAAITKDGGVVQVGRNVQAVSNNTLVIGFTAEPQHTSIVLQVSDEIATPSLDALLATVAKGNKASGKKLITIDKTYENWQFKPYAMSGQKWHVVTDVNKKIATTLTAYLPISCDDIEYYFEELQSTFIITQGEQQIPYTNECSALAKPLDEATKYSYAQSSVPIKVTLDPKALKMGERTLGYTFSIPNINGEERLTTELTRKIALSAPMYVSWTYDWDAMNGSAYLDSISELRKALGYIPVTHYFNPRIWNSSAISKASADAQIAFVKKGQSTMRDEVQLHMHMFTDMITKAGVTPPAVPGWGSSTDGYDVPFSEVAYEDSKTLITWALNEFKAKGLPKPTTIRAGGWMMDMENLRAARDAGILIDSSSRTAFSTRNINSQGHSYPGPWAAQITTQPYWIHPSNQNSGTSKAKSMGLYEIPNNGGDSWAFSKEALLSRFKSNYAKEQLDSPKIVTYITHPDFYKTEGPKISAVLLSIATLQAGNDDGPVVFTTAYEFYKQYAK